jgi:hypothetical protein
LLPSAPPSAAETAKAASAKATSAEAITAAETTATAKAITAAKSSTAKTVAPEAAAVTTLEILEPLTRKIATRSVLSLTVQIAGATSTSTTRSVEAATGAISAAFSGAIVAGRFG